MEPLIGVIGCCIDELSKAKMWEKAEILRMARLDLIARVNGISDEELEQFAGALHRGGMGK